jgi:hypothetical protein
MHESRHHDVASCSQERVVSNETYNHPTGCDRLDGQSICERLRIFERRVSQLGTLTAYDRSAVSRRGEF